MKFLITGELDKSKLQEEIQGKFPETAIVFRDDPDGVMVKLSTTAPEQKIKEIVDKYQDQKKENAVSDEAKQVEQTEQEAVKDVCNSLGENLAMLAKKMSRINGIKDEALQNVNKVVDPLLKSVESLTTENSALKTELAQMKTWKAQIDTWKVMIDKKLAGAKLSWGE